MGDIQLPKSMDRPVSINAHFVEEKPIDLSTVLIYIAVGIIFLFIPLSFMVIHRAQIQAQAQLSP